MDKEFNVDLVSGAVKATGARGFQVVAATDDFVTVTLANKNNPFMAMGEIQITFDDDGKSIIGNSSDNHWILDTFFVRFEGTFVIVDGRKSDKIDLANPENNKVFYAAIKREIEYITEFEYAVRPAEAKFYGPTEPGQSDS